MERTAWSNIVLTDCDGTYINARRERVTFLKAMEEYRQTGCMSGWFFEGAEELDDEEAADYGLDVDEIDWEGFDEALARIECE